MWRIRNAVEGTIVLGQSGSGKSSGSGRALSRAFLAAGFGGVVLMCKDDTAEWERLAAQCGRSGDIVRFGPGAGHVFDFIEHTARSAGGHAGLTENLVGLIEVVSEIGSRGTGGVGQDRERFWVQNSQRLQRCAIDLMRLGAGSVSLAGLQRVVNSSPSSYEQVRSESWRSESYCCRLLAAADAKPLSPEDKRDFEILTEFFLIELPSMGDRTRSSIFATFFGAVDVLQRGMLRSLFSGRTTITPNIVEDGAIILLDMPIMQYREAGQVAQALFKACFQREIERRDLTRSARPVFLWADEAQYTLHSGDHLFATTCRSSRVANVMLTQSIGNFASALGGGDRGSAQAASLLGNMGTKLFHAQSDPETNDYAASLVGRKLDAFVNTSVSRGGQGMASADWMGLLGGEQVSAGVGEHYESELHASDFTGLGTGGPENDFGVDSILFMAGRRFSNGRAWMPVTFKQEAEQ